MSDNLPPEFPTEEPKTASELEEATVVETPTTPDPADEEQYYIRLDKRKYGEEISRLQREDPHFKEVFRSISGNYAKRQYESQLQERDRQLEELRRNIRREEFQRIPQEQLGQQLAQNPQLAQEYAQVTKPADPQEEYSRQVVAEINRLKEDAIDNGLDDDQAEEVYQKALTDNPNVDVPTFLKTLRKNLVGAIVDARVPGVVAANNSNGQAQVQQEPKPAPNLALQTGAPVGNASRGNRGSIKYTKQQIDDMLAGNPTQFMKEFPEPDSFDKAVASGLIQGMGPNQQ